MKMLMFLLVAAGAASYQLGGSVMPLRAPARAISPRSIATPFGRPTVTAEGAVEVLYDGQCMVSARLLGV